MNRVRSNDQWDRKGRIAPGLCKHALATLALGQRVGSDLSLGPRLQGSYRQSHSQSTESGGLRGCGETVADSVGATHSGSR